MGALRRFLSFSTDNSGCCLCRRYLLVLLLFLVSCETCVFCCAVLSCPLGYEYFFRVCSLSFTLFFKRPFFYPSLLSCSWCWCADSRAVPFLSCCACSRRAHCALFCALGRSPRLDLDDKDSRSS
ncbi:hypothetical protein BDY21DRAFT_334053, partial [Lineolata rhizophorae]